MIPLCSIPYNKCCEGNIISCSGKHREGRVAETVREGARRYSSLNSKAEKPVGLSMLRRMPTVIGDTISERVLSRIVVRCAHFVQI